MIDLDTLFDPAQVDARNAARFGTAAGNQAHNPGTPTNAQRAAALIADVADDALRVALRDGFEERMSICTIDGGLTDAQAERIALAEVRDTLATWREI
jgi:hypothetical protein